MPKRPCIIYTDGNPDKFAEYAFRAFDTDHSGEIDFTEFLLAIAVNRSGDIKAKLELAFEMCDADRNGIIDHKELTQILSAIYELKGAKSGSIASPISVAADVFKKADLNMDSKISKEEFVYICMNDQRVRQLLAPNV
ncbi:hypothetical protein ACOME3_007822 [Neoechinorhynchus agilis]